MTVRTDLELSKVRVPRSLGMGRTFEVLLEFRKLGHAFAVCLKVRELLVGPQSTTGLIISTGSIEVLDRLEKLEVCKGGLVATEELLLT